MKIKMLVNAYCPTVDDVDELCNRFWENYSYFFEDCDAEEDEYAYNEETGDVHIVWIGEANEDFDADDIDDFIRLTHHAEGLYEDSNIEYTHVEVCIDEKWYGR